MSEATFATKTPIKDYISEFNVQEARHPLFWERNEPIDGPVEELVARFKTMTGNPATHVSNAKKARKGDNKKTTSIMAGFPTGPDYYPQVAESTSRCPQHMELSSKFVRTAKFLHLVRHKDAIVEGWANAVDASEERRTQVSAALDECIHDWMAALAVAMTAENKRIEKEERKQGERAAGTKSSKKRLVTPSQ